MGDVILTSPLLRVLKNSLPDTSIDFLIRKKFSELVQYNPHINKIIAYDNCKGLRELTEELKKNNYDLIIDLHNNLRSNFVKLKLRKKSFTINKRIFKRFLLINFKINFLYNYIPVPEKYIEAVRDLNINNDQNGLEIFFPEEMKTNLKEKLKNQSIPQNRLIVGVAPSAKHNTKRWPAHKFEELLVKLVKELNAFVLAFGGEEEEDYIEDIVQTVNQNTGNNFAMNLAGKLSILENAAAMDICKVIVTNDTGLMHLAAARKRKVVAIFGPTVKEFGFFPYGTENIVIENNNLNCRPCTHIGRDRCPKKHFRCMNDITSEKVFDAIKHILNIK